MVSHKLTFGSLTELRKLGHKNEISIQVMTVITMKAMQLFVVMLRVLPLMEKDISPVVVQGLQLGSIIRVMICGTK